MTASGPDRPVPVSEWSAAAFLRLARRVREFNRRQLELQERWLRAYGLVPSDR